MVPSFLFLLLCGGWAGALCIIRSYGCIYMSMCIYKYIYTDYFGILSHRNLEHNLWISFGSITLALNLSNSTLNHSKPLVAAV